MFENADHQISRQHQDSFAGNSLALEAFSQRGANLNRSDNMQGSDLIAQGILPDASHLLHSLSTAQSADRTHAPHLHTHNESHTNQQHHHSHHHSHHRHRSNHHEQVQHHEHAATPEHKHHESHAEKLAHIRKEIEENIKAIKEQYPVGNPDRIVFIAAEMGKDPERWKSPDGNGKCNVFVEAVLKEAGVQFPWKEGHATAHTMMQELLKDKNNFDVAYKFNGKDDNENFHKHYQPRNGDIIVWYKNGAEHIGIVGYSPNGRGVIFTAGVHEDGATGHHNGYACYDLDTYTSSPNYGPPSYVFRSKH